MTPGRPPGTVRMHTAPLQALRDAPTSDQRESSGRRALGLEDVPASRLESSQDLSLHGDPRDLQTPSEQLQGRGRPTRDPTPHLSRVSPPGPKPAASPGGAQEAAATERLGREDPLEEGKTNPLQYFCLGNPMDGGAWWVIVHGLSKSRV